MVLVVAKMSANYCVIGLLLVGLIGLSTYCEAVEDVHGLPGFNGRAIDLSKIPFPFDKEAPWQEQRAQYWYDRAYDEIAKRLELPQPNGKKAKNIILFLGDGMSLSTVTAARILKGQREGRNGEESSLSFEKFPHMGLSKTYCANGQVPDSACTATAYLCGVKTNIFGIGVNAAMKFNDCSTSQNPANRLTSIAEWAQNAGKATGIVTTTSLTHASPSGAYAKTANRLWECDSDIANYGADPSTCVDIATQLITQKPGMNFDIMLGGGMGKFLPKSIEDSYGNAGERSDGKNLLARWQGLHSGGVLLTKRQHVKDVNVNDVSKIIGLFHSKVMDYHMEANADQPTLAEMTELTIRKLSQNKNGYFAFIEGGLIDHANHHNKAGYALDETIEFEKAVQLARDLTDIEDTLIVVTADHGHTLSIAGYPARGNPILGFNKYGDANGVKYSTLNYATGSKNYMNAQGQRMDPSNQVYSADSVYPSYITMDLGAHSGDDVGVYASGPQSHLFTGVMEQSTIAHMMAYAGCIGDGPNVCGRK